MSISKMQVKGHKRRLNDGENLFVLNVREKSGYEISSIGDSLIPQNKLQERTEELDANREILAVCKMRIRSGPTLTKDRISQYLQPHGRDRRPVRLAEPDGSQILTATFRQ